MRNQLLTQSVPTPVPTSTPKIPSKHSRDESFTPLNQFLENNNTLAGERSHDDIDTSTDVKKKKRKSLGSSISRVFSRGKARKSITVPPEEKESDGRLQYGFGLSF